MTPQETLRERKADFEKLLYANMDRTLARNGKASRERLPESLEARRALVQPMVDLSEAADAYRKALVAAAPHVAQEVGEDYVKAARELPAQLTFLLSTLSAYHASKSSP